MTRSRAIPLLVTIAVGVIFVLGLAIHGPVGGTLLLAVAVTLVMFSAGAWSRVHPRGRIVRLLVLAVVVVLAVAKLAGRL